MRQRQLVSSVSTDTRLTSAWFRSSIRCRTKPPSAHGTHVAVSSRGSTVDWDRIDRGGGGGATTGPGSTVVTAVLLLNAKKELAFCSAASGCATVASSTSAGADCSAPMRCERDPGPGVVSSPRKFPTRVRWFGNEASARRGCPDVGGDGARQQLAGDRAPRRDSCTWSLGTLGQPRA